jgi:ATP-dependent Lon protease
MKHWLKWATTIPYDNYKVFPFNKKELTTFLQKVSVKLDEELYGMKSAKEQILIFLNAKILNPHMRKCSLGLIGSPGTGKTRLARVLADILGFPFEQISLGGVSDPSFLKGHQYTYIGAQPGEIVKCLQRMGHKNGILFLDEYDKISDNKDLCSALLHITDSSQNSGFSDTFLSGLVLDLSYLWFVYSMNELPKDDALRDRVFIIEVPGYDKNDKVNILREYMLPNALKNVKMDKDSVIMSEKVAEHIVTLVSSDDEQGVRSIEKAMNGIINKLAFIRNHQDRNGNLNFNVSFNLSKKILFPLDLTEEHVNTFLTHSTPRLGPVN